MSALALGILIAYGVSLVWDVLEPDAVTVRFNSPMRVLLSVAILCAVIALCLIIVL